MAQVIPLRRHTFRLDNCVIDHYAAEMGAIGVAIYAALQRYADRTTGQCWPSVPTIAAQLGLSKNCIKKYLHHLAQLGLIDIASRYAPDGDHTSNLYTVHDPTQTEALRRRRLQRGGASIAGGGASGTRPPADMEHLMTDGRAPDAPKQDSKEQYLLTSVSPSKTTGHPCDNPAHEHRSPIPGLQMCLDCFRHWPVPLVASTPTHDTERC